MKKTAMILPILFLLILTGCWGKKELNEVAVVVGMGLDKIEDRYQVTAQVIKPIPTKAAAGGGSELPTWSFSASGKTVMDALFQLSQISPRPLYWSHLQLIIFGEALAKEGVRPVITWFQRNKESSPNAYLVLTNGKAEDLLNQKIELGKIPAKSMADLIKTSDARNFTARKMTMRRFITFLSETGVDPSIDIINPKKIRGKVETYQLSGIAVFKNDKLAGYIKEPVQKAPSQFEDDSMSTQLSPQKWK